MKNMALVLHGSRMKRLYHEFVGKYVERFLSEDEEGKNTPQESVLSDVRRGEEGRFLDKNLLPRVTFEPPESLSKLEYHERSGDIFFGVVHGKTTPETRVDGRKEYITKGGTAVGMSDDRHITTIASTRSGKGRSAIIPNLLGYGGSVLIIDPKGENAAVTARYRKSIGQEVRILDPFKITPKHCIEYRMQLNPLMLLRRTDNLHFVEDAGMIADALIVPSGGENTHWDESAKGFLEGLILHVVLDTQLNPKKRNLVTVANLLMGVGEKPMTIKQLLADMIRRGKLLPIVAAAKSLWEMDEKERSGVVSTARKNMRFLQYSAMQEVMSGQDYYLDELITKKTTIYLVLPAMRLATCAQWLRLFINMTLASIETAPVRPAIPTLLILDEFAVLGYMRELEKGIGQIAGMGVRFWTILQDLGQLKAIYKERWETFLGNSGVIQCFGNVDYFTSEWISKYLDKTTITVYDKNSNGPDDKNRKGASGEGSKLQVTDLMTPSEARRAFARDDHLNRQLILIPGKSPFIIQRVNYYDHERYVGRFDPWKPIAYQGLEEE